MINQTSRHSGNRTKYCCDFGNSSTNILEHGDLCAGIIVADSPAGLGEAVLQAIGK